MAGRGMDGMLAQYGESCAALRRRVAELNDRMAGRVPMGEGETLQVLEGRRLRLYHQLWEMEEAMEAMASYRRHNTNIR